MPASQPIPIYAERYWTNTRFAVRAGEKYRIEASGTWNDGDIVTGPAGYRSPNFLFVLLSSFRREPRAKWFALVGGVDRNKDTQFLIGEGTTWTAPVSGTLTCFANDLPFFYFNNSGQVALTITRIG